MLARVLRCPMAALSLTEVRHTVLPRMLFRIPARALLWSGLLFCAAGCEPAENIPSSYYRLEREPPLVELVFAPGRAEPQGAAPRLRVVAAQLPEQAWVVLYAGGPVAVARARAVGRLLARPVELLASPPTASLPPDTGLLVVQTTPGVVYDACRGPSSRGIEDIWPGNDDRRTFLMPPGCAVGTALKAQTVDPADLLRGRPLPSGAATPFAAAIERYYRRNDGNIAAGTAETAPARESSSQVSPVPAPTPTAGANPLLGPLTR